MRSAQSSQHQPTLTCDLSLEPYDNYISRHRTVVIGAAVATRIALEPGRRQANFARHFPTGRPDSFVPALLCAAWALAGTPASSRQARHCLRWIAHSGKV